MLLQIQCPVCKQAFLISPEQAGGQVSCPQGHVLAVQGTPTPPPSPAAPSPSKATGTVARTILEPTAPPPSTPTPPPPPAQPRAVPPTRKTAMPAQATGQRKTAVPPGKPAPSAARPTPAPAPARPTPAAADPPPSGPRWGLAIVCTGVILLFLVATGGLAVYLILNPADRDSKQAGGPAAEVRLLVGQKQEVDEEFRVQAAVRDPAPGQTLTLELPNGVKVVRGSAQQEVPAAAAGQESMLSWTVKGTTAGTRKLTVRSSTGTTQEVSVDLVRPSEAGQRAQREREGSGQPGSSSGTPGGDAAPARTELVVRVLGGEKQEVGKDVSVDALLPGAVGGETLTLELPEGVTLVTGAARQEVKEASKLQAAASWVIKGASTGSKELTVRCKDGTAQSVTVSFRDKPTSVVGGKLDLHRLDKLDLSTLDVQLGPARPDEKTPDVWDGHTNHIRCVAFTDDGQLVISVSGDQNRKIKRPADNSIRVWDARRGKQLHKVEGFKEALDSLAISSGGRFALFAAGDYYDGDDYVRATDTGISMWDIQTKKVVSFDTDDPSSGGAAEKGKAKPRFQGLTSTVFATAISPDCKYVVGGDATGGLILWETETAQVVHSSKIYPIRGLMLGLGRIAFTPDGDHLVFDYADFTLRVHRRDTGRPVSLPLQSHLDIIWALAVRKNADGTVLALSGGGNRPRLDNKGYEPGARDYALRLWDLSHGRVIRQLTGHEGMVLSVAFCPDGRHCVSCGKDETLRLWDLDTGKQLRILGRQEGTVNSVAVSPDGRSCVSGGDDCKIHFWHLPTGQDLVEALARNDLSALQKAARDMDVIGTGALAALSPLVVALSHDNQPFRPLAAQILSRLSELSAPKGIPYEDTHVEGLHKALQGDNPPEVHTLAAQGLGQVGPRASKAIPVLIHALQSSKSVQVAAAAVESLGKIGDKGDAVLSALQKALEHPEASVRSRALLALTRLDPDKMPLQTLLARLETDSSGEVQRMADRALRERFPSLTRKDLPTLQTGLKSRRPQVCVCCADAVAALRSEAAAAAAEVIALLERQEEEVRLAGLRALRALGEAGKDAVPALTKLIQLNPDRRSGAEAATILVKLDPDNPLVGAMAARLVEALRPKTADEAKAASASPLESEGVRKLLDIGEPAIGPLFQSGLVLWAPQKGTKNKDVLTAVARHQAYTVLSELAGRATLDERLRQALRSRATGFRQSYLAREKTLLAQAQVQAQLRQLSEAELAMYARTAEAAEGVQLKLKVLLSDTHQEEAEKKADIELAYARKLLDRGEKDKAKERLESIAKKYTGTRSAAEAKKLLQSLAD